MNIEQVVAEITQEVQENFKTIGGGRATPGSFIEAMLKDTPLTFSSGVSVEAVTQFVVTSLLMKAKQSAESTEVKD